MAAGSLDQQVRLAVYEALVGGSAMPTAEEVARQVGVAPAEVAAAFARVTSLVPEPGDPGRLRMAKPFSAIETPFAVRAASHQWWANCIWDALGVAAIVGVDSDIDTTCGDCGEPMALRIRGGKVEGAGVVHFGTPARDWWKDIVYT